MLSQGFYLPVYSHRFSNIHLQRTLLLYEYLSNKSKQAKSGHETISSKIEVKLSYDGIDLKNAAK